VSVTLDTLGTVATANLKQSSGYPALDRAALTSVRDHWRFDVAHCDSTALAIERVVDVNYRSAAGRTLSGTVNTRAARESKRLLAASQCHVKRSGDDTVFACLQNVTTSVASAK
jgi:TonB family protein